MSEAQEKPVASPCVYVCALGDDDICVGCQRSGEEITRWGRMDNAERRAVPERGVATVVYHSIVMPYLGREGVRRFAGIVRDAGARASAAAPLAWLFLEPSRREDGGWEHAVRLTLWPGGEPRLLALSSPHGPPVQWKAP